MGPNSREDLREGGQGQDGVDEEDPDLTHSFSILEGVGLLIQEGYLICRTSLMCRIGDSVIY